MDSFEMRGGGSFFRLQRHMADAEMLFQFFGRVKQRFIGRGAVRCDQMAGQRVLGRAERPDVQVV
jgi:hypothetical protein